MKLQYIYRAIFLFMITLLLWLHPRGSEVVRASGSCAVAVGAPSIASQSGDRTQEFVAYLQELLDRNTIGDKELEQLTATSDKNSIQNPISINQKHSSHTHSIHREGLQSILETGLIDFDRVKAFADSALKKRRREIVKRKSTEEETLHLFSKPEFIRVSEGDFVMVSREGKPTKNHVRLLQTVDVMNNKVTQGQWVELLGANPQRGLAEEGAIDIQVNGKIVRLIPDEPVLNFTWFSALVYANEMSKKYGLTPVYDLSDMKWKANTDAGAGTLARESGKIKINAPDGDIYRAEGFRLPTRAELIYLVERILVSSKGYKRKVSGTYDFNRTFVDKAEIFNFISWLFEMGWDEYAESQVYKGDNPVENTRPRKLNPYMNRFALCFAGVASREEPLGTVLKADEPNASTGLRLVRTIHE